MSASSATSRTDPPVVEPGEAEDGRSVLKVTATDYVLGKKLELDADILALAAAVIPSARPKRWPVSSRSP